MGSESVRVIARDPRAVVLWGIAARITGLVYRGNVERLLDSAEPATEVNGLYRQFRAQAEALGYAVPDTDEALYSDFIRPLHLTHVHEGH